MFPFDHSLPIWHPEGAGTNQTILFESDFTVESPKDCILHLHVNSNYALYINNNFVDCGSFSDFPSYRTYDTINLSSFVVPGENRFSLYAYYQGTDSFTVIQYPPEAIFSLREKDEEILLSAPGFPVQTVNAYHRDVPSISPQLAFSFEYNALLPLGPVMPAVATALSAGLVNLRPIEKLQIEPACPATVTLIGNCQKDPSVTSDYPAPIMQHSFRALSHPAVPPVLQDLEGSDSLLLSGNDVILDLGKEMVGFLLLDLELSQSAKILIGWGEHLDDGHVRTEIGPRNFAARITLPTGRTRYFYPFKRMAFRYLELQLMDPSVSCTLHYAGIKPVFYPLKKLNTFTCADALHRRIYEVSLRTLLHCMHEHYEDCPWREQALYTMDSRNQMLIGYYTFEEYRFARTSLSLIAKGIRSDGYLELINPGKAPITIPSFTAIYLIQAAEYLRYTEDFTFLREILPVLHSIADHLLSRIDQRGLIPREADPKYWEFYEWQTGLDGHTVPLSPENGVIYDAPMQAFAAMALSSMASIEMRLGDPKRTDHYFLGVDTIRQAFHKTFYSAEVQGYHSFALYDCLESSDKMPTLLHLSELTQSLAICADLVPEANTKDVLALLAGSTSLHLKEPFYPVTLSHSVFKYEALLRDPEQYASYVFRDIEKKFGHMLSHGATTFWETIDGGDAFDNAGSLCHGWSAIPAYFYLKYVVDIKKEGTALPSHLTGIYQPKSEPVKDPGRKILYS